jgi:hypothetical protein
MWSINSLTFMEQENPLPLTQKPAVLPILHEINSVYTPSINVVNLASMSGSPNSAIPFGLFYQYSVCNFQISHVHYIPRLSQAP